MTTIRSLIHTIAGVCKGSTGPVQTQRDAQAAGPAPTPSHDKTQLSAEASEPKAVRKINYFEFACCYHTSGLCLIGMKGIG